MLAMVQEKVALEKEVEYNIDPNVEFDREREELVLGVNSQVLRVNLLRR